MNICVYGAASNAIDKSYIEAVEILGSEMAKRGHNLVYGGGAMGLMGAVARGVKSQNGQIIGVAPTFFKGDGIIFDRCTELIRTNTMRERKQIMEDRSDCFIMVPGGIGTFEEFFEILTLKQLHRHEKAIAVYNINGYYDSMQNMLENAIAGAFVRENCKNLYKFFDDRDAMLAYLEEYVPADVKPNEYKNI